MTTHTRVLPIDDQSHKNLCDLWTAVVQATAHLDDVWDNSIEERHAAADAQVDAMSVYEKALDRITR